MEVLGTRPQRWNDVEAAAAAFKSEGILAASILPGRDRFSFLTADGQTATPLEQEALLGDNDLLEASFLDRCILVRECVGRVHFNTPRGRSYATGFLIAPGLLLTNQHVFIDAERADGASIEFGYRYDVAGQAPYDTDQYELLPGRFFVAEESLDFAVVAVAERSRNGRRIADRGFLRLIPATGKAALGEFVTIIQHPDGAEMQIALRENEIVRLREDEPFIWYKADTAHGSSGAAVFNDSLQLVALHSSGRIRRDDQGRYALARGGFTDSLEGLGESDVVWEANVGYRVSRIAPTLLELAGARFPDFVPVIEAAFRGGDVLSTSVVQLKGSGTSIIQPEEREMTDSSRGNGSEAFVSGSGGDLIIPLRLRISLEGAGGVASPAAIASPRPALETEALQMRIPIIYDGLDERDGFDPRFLDLEDGEEAPAPILTDKGRQVAAPLLDGSGTELKYHHFSIWMHKDRRLALFTASNVDWRARAKIVDGKKTTRKALAGFPEKPEYAEQWVNDPRIDERHQLPDIFYTEDRGAFDKGHLVRRDDVCWGRRYSEIQMANGDTYHVTNCSPQIKPFNQGPFGEENWGDFESHVQSATERDNEKAIIFAGPIFDPADRWFRGKDAQGPARIQVPSRFWKIVLVKGDAGPEAFGFILSQDVTSITEEEFFVTEEWVGSMRPISEIQGLLRGWISLEGLIAVDQHPDVA